MSWRLAKSLDILRNQVNAAYPNRSKANDGTIGDAAHAATKSEHNPDSHGVVRAMDITNDPGHGLVSRKLAESLITSRDPRILYVISNREICSSEVSPWVWRPYYGKSPHTEHMHLSVLEKGEDDTTPWKIDAKPVVIIAHPTDDWASGRGSWYSQFKGKYNWRDTGDEPNSDALGVDDKYQGISFYRHDTLGHWFEVEYPNGHRSIEQQTDIGPAPWTGRKIDIAAAAAERAGYSPDTLHLSNAFPTDSTIRWRPIPAPAGLEGLTPKQQAIKYSMLRANI